MKIISGLSIILVSLMLGVVPVFAHAVVKPDMVGVGSFVDFSLGVPSEKDSSTVSVKLILPEGINSVTPIVKSGWSVQIINSTKEGEPDDDGNVNPTPEAIVWTGGAIPAHQKDFFMFSTQVPVKEMELDWKIEQTYADGTMVSWTKNADAQPKDEKGESDFSQFGPYSKTMVINDLTKPDSSDFATTRKDTRPLMFSIIAIALSATAITMQLRKRS